MLLVSCRSGVISQTTREAVPSPPGCREALVPEPVFHGTAYIIEAGMEHAVSVVLVHGLGDNGARDWDHLIPALAEHYHVVAFDLPGFGRSSRQNENYRPARYAEFVNWVIGRTVNGPFVLIGHSLGGAVALRVATMSPPGLQRVIVADVAGILHRVAFTHHIARLTPRQWQASLPGNPIDTVNDLARAFLDIMDRESISKNLEGLLDAPALRIAVLGSDPKKIAALALIIDDYSEVIDQVRTPVLILWGENDAIAPLRTSRILAGRLPDSRLEIIRGAGHVPMLEQPEQFNRIVLREIASDPLAGRNPAAGEPAGTSDRVGSCSRQDGMKFTGAYRLIEVKDCRHVEIANVTAGKLDVTDSEVVIENSRIISGAVSLKADRSELVLTNVTVEGDVAIETSQSRFDLAGVKLVGKKAAVSAKRDSVLIFSVSRIESPHTTGTLHGSRTVTAEKPL